MSDAKKEELRIVVDSQEMPEKLKRSARFLLEQQTIMDDLRGENDELQITVIVSPK